MAIYSLQLLRRTFVYNISSRSFSSKCAEGLKSSLFISGERAKDTFVVVVPHLDFDQRFENLPLLEENLRRRRMKLNAAEMKDSWEFYKDWNAKKLLLQENFSKVRKQLNEMQKSKESSENNLELQKLQHYENMLKDDLSTVKKNVWSMEDNVIGQLLQLPNYIHPETPDIEENIFITDQEISPPASDHLEVGARLNNLEYFNQFTCYLKNEAALFELAVSDFFLDKFIENGFIQFSNPDFARSVLNEGIGLPPGDDSESFLLEQSESNNELLHLCGGASLFPFCGYHAKHSVSHEYLPVRYVASGRRYSPQTPPLPGLYSVFQSTSVHFFIGTSQDSLYQEFESVTSQMQTLYSSLGLKFKIVKQPAHSVKNWETLGLSFQVFSPHHGVFVEVGNVSVIDDFISKRLRMFYADKTGELFLKVVSGTVVNAQTLLALCLERSEHSLLVPDILKDYFIT